MNLSSLGQFVVRDEYDEPVPGVKNKKPRTMKTGYRVGFMLKDKTVIDLARIAPPFEDKQLTECFAHCTEMLEHHFAFAKESGKDVARIQLFLNDSLPPEPK